MAGSAEVARKQWGVDAPSIIEAFLAIQPWLFASTHVLGFADFLCRIPIWTKYGEISCAEFLFEPILGNTYAGERDTISLNMFEILILYWTLAAQDEDTQDDTYLVVGV